MREEVEDFFFGHANLRDTYDTVHHVRAAHELARGKGVKVGVIDWLFALEKHPHLYKQGVSFTRVSDHLHQEEGHGLWMAAVLNEIAPECEIYAINAVLYEDGISFEDQQARRSQHLVHAIDWAIQNQLDILTYSHARIPDEFKPYVYPAMERAHEQGILMTFIHNDHSHNLWPYACYPYKPEQGFQREPDVNIFHFDYNILLPRTYQRYREAVDKGEPIRSGNDLPYFSFSSMSPVLAGFAALLKSADSRLTTTSIKSLLEETSYSITATRPNWYELNPCPRVVDIRRALEYVRS
ncbi:hypothetical protein [Gorillibacterium sp. CAU 1737]|uniref:hypothetical protein n=1 Tax=Gorillibacterium sp. CAU 1737 TaxID=3140362 RepID=UPI0032613B21